MNSTNEIPAACRKRTLDSMSRGELLELLESQFSLAADQEVDALRARWAHHQACHLVGRDAADHVANLLVQVRERLAVAAGAADQRLICQVAETLQQVRDAVAMAGKALRQQELVWGIATMSPNSGMSHEVELLNWAMAVLMGRTAESAPAAV